MVKADSDLSDVLKEKGKLDFIEFFPLYQDCIIALAFIHSNFIIHRDLKTDNIMKMSHGRWALGDYGVGENLKV